MSRFRKEVKPSRTIMPPERSYLSAALRDPEIAYDRQHLKQSCTYVFAAPHEQTRCREGTCATTHTHDQIARHTQRRPNAGNAAHCPAVDVVEELELRQSICEVFSGSVKRDHSELCRAQKHVRHMRARGATG